MIRWTALELKRLVVMRVVAILVTVLLLLPLLLLLGGGIPRGIPPPSLGRQRLHKAPRRHLS